MTELYFENLQVNLVNSIVFNPRSQSNTQFSVTVCLCVFLPGEDLAPIETRRRNIVDT